MDGPTTSKSGFSGPIGKLLQNVNEMDYSPEFEALPGGEPFPDIPETVLKNMSTDQKLSYKLCICSKAGELPSNLREIQCGPLNHARWLTTGMRLLYLWTRKHDLKEKEFEDLRILVRFSLDCYFKVYFDIKTADRIEDAPYHILSQLRILKRQPIEVQNIVSPYVRLGAWYAHSENILIALLASKSSDDRCFAVQEILKLRGNNQYGNMNVRPRKTPKLNFNALTIKELINWNTSEILEPALTCSLTAEDLSNFREEPLKTPSVKIHTQATERAAKQVTEAAAAVVGFDARDGFIRARVHHREELPEFKSKKDIMKIMPV